MTDDNGAIGSDRGSAFLPLALLLVGVGLLVVLVLSRFSSPEWKALEMDYPIPPGGQPLRIDFSGSFHGSLTIYSRDLRDGRPKQVNALIYGPHRLVKNALDGHTLTLRGDACILYVPPDLPLELETNQAHVQIFNLHASVRATLSHGTFEASNIAGAVDVTHVGFMGEGVYLDNIKGAVRVAGSGGWVTLSNITGDVEVKNSNQAIFLSGQKGSRVEIISTSWGPIRFSNIEDKQIDLEGVASFSMQNVKGVLKVSRCSNGTIAGITSDAISLQMCRAIQFVDSRRPSMPAVNLRYCSEITFWDGFEGAVHQMGSRNVALHGQTTTNSAPVAPASGAGRRVGQ